MMMNENLKNNETERRSTIQKLSILGKHIIRLMY